MSLLESNTEALERLMEEVNNLPNPNPNGASVQSDWNQTDETAADFIKNKTHYDGYNSVKLDETITFDSDGGAEIAPMGLVAGQLYTMRYGNTIYSAVAFDATELGIAGYVLLGNLTDFGVPSGEEIPFDIVEITGTAAILNARDGAGSSVPVAIVEGDEIGDTVNVEDAYSGYAYYRKVSDRCPTEADLSNDFQIEGSRSGEEFIATKSEIGQQAEGATLMLFAQGLPAVFILYEADSETGLSAGTYLVNTEGLSDSIGFDMRVKSFTVYNTTVFAKKIEMKRMDEKYLPERIVLTSPSGKKFNIAVDDSGTITATEVTE